MDQGRECPDGPGKEDTLLQSLASLLSRTSQLTPSHFVGAGKCQKPQWDPKLIFDPNQGTYNPNEVVNMRCPEGSWPPPMEIKCVTLKSRESSGFPRGGWVVKNATDTWHLMEKNLTCVGK